jgi:hypothetical protein
MCARFAQMKSGALFCVCRIADDERMEKIIEQVGTVEFWVLSIVVPLIVGIAGNRLDKRIGTIHGDKVLRYALVLNALAIPILVASPYSVLVGEIYIDVLIAVAVTCLYIVAAIGPSRRLRVYAFFAPNLTVVALGIFAFRAGVTGTIQTLVSIYPFAFVLHVFVILGWLNWFSHKLQKQAP